MKEAEIAAVNDEPRWAGIGLDHVTKLWMGVFEAGRRMRVDGIHEELIEIGSFEFGVAGGVDLGCELENLGHVFAGDGARQNDWRIWNEIEIIFEIVEDFVAALAFEVGLCDDENNALAGVDNLASERLVELRMWLSAINKHAANIGLFYGGEAAESAELFDAHFAFAWLAEAGGVEQFNRAALVTDFGAVNITSGAGEVSNDGLLLLRKRVKEAGFADVWAANQGNLDAVIGLFFPFAHIETEVFELGDNFAAKLVQADAGGRGNTDWILGAKHQEFFVWKGFTEVGFVEQEKNWFAGFKSLFGDHFVVMVWIFATIESEQNKISVCDGVFDLILNMSLKFVVRVLEAGSVDEDIAIVDFAHNVVTSSTGFACNNSRRLVNEAIKDAGFASISLANNCYYR